MHQHHHIFLANRGTSQAEAKEFDTKRSQFMRMWDAFKQKHNIYKLPEDLANYTFAQPLICSEMRPCGRCMRQGL